MKYKAVFLDRDGVLNEAIIKNNKPYSPASLEEIIIPADAKYALSKLKKAGFLLIGATNQPDVARKNTSQSQVELINKSLLNHLELDDIRVCYHDDNHDCLCRKPKPGLITEAAIQHNIDLSLSYMIGDRWKDIEAGIEAGCHTIWLHNDYNEPKPPRAPSFVARSLSDAADWIISTSK